MDSPDLVRAAEVLRRAERVWIGTHRDPDGDAIGSLLGLGHLLEARGSRVSLACPDRVPDDFTFLPRSGEVTAHGPEPDIDVCVAIDAGDRDRLAQLVDADAWSRRLTVVLDHHRSNPGFGTVNVVLPEAASSCQMVLWLAEHLGTDISPTVATCLLTGHLTDTLGFRTSNTDARALRDAATLVDRGAPLHDLAERVFGMRPLASLRMWARAVERLEVRADVGVATLTVADFATLGGTPADTKGLSSFLLQARELRVAGVVRERGDGTCDVSLRSRPGVDLVPVTQTLGGGGHPQAAGATIAGPLDAAVRVLWTTLAGTSARP